MRRLPFLTSAQRRALLVLEWVLLIGIIGFAVWKSQSRTPQPPLGGETRKREWNGSPAKQFTYAEDEESFETFPFDPNTADSTTLLRLGLAPWQVRSIYHYRAKHGRYHTPEDFQYLPGLTVEQWERLKDCIRIAPEFRYLNPPPRKASSSTPFQREERKEREDTLHKVSLLRGNSSLIAEQLGSESDGGPKGLEGSGDMIRSVKLSPGQTIDINTADTSQLKMIPGIASKRAARIVAYRAKLGGFVSIEQAMEAAEMPDSVLKYMTVSALPVQKINVNKLSVQRLMNHPYLNFYQAKAINEYRRNKGELHSIEELSRLESFRPSDIDRLKPYVEF